MSNDPYLTPTGLVYGPEAGDAMAAGAAGPLAGGAIGYMAVWIECGSPGHTDRQLCGYEAFAASRDQALIRGRALLECSRSAFGGLDLSRPCIMGVINVTPDSFSDGGELGNADAAIAHGRGLLAAGADILDIGGESTRPGAREVSADCELARILPVVRDLAGAGATISVDTRKTTVMEQAAVAGAAIINDVSALTHDPRALAAAAALDLPVILMHTKGDPQNMQDDPRYDDVRLEVFDALRARLEACDAAGIKRTKLCIDPGIGFGKTFAHNVTLLQGLTLFHGAGVPVLVGASRKGFIGWLTGEKAANRRQSGSVAAALGAVSRGAQIVRVHDVAETAQALAVWNAAGR